MGRPPLGPLPVTGAERQRRYWRRLRARLDAAPIPAPTPTPALTWHRKAHEAIGIAGDVEYIIARTPEGDFEINFYPEGSDDLLFVGDGFPTMAEAEAAAEQHNRDRQCFDRDQ